jgi:hypothetical protein
VTLPRFTLQIANSAGAVLADVSDFTSWTLTQNLDDGCSITFDTRGDSAAGQNIDELATDVLLAQDLAIIERQRIVGVSQVWGPSGEDDVAVTTACYRRLLKKAHVRSPLTYSGITQGTIIWNLIQHAQAATGGNLGITLAAAGPAVTRDRTYEVGKNIFDAIVELTQVINGPTWDINSALQLTVSQAALYPTNLMPIELGNIARGMSRPSSAAQFGNAVVVTGDALLTTPVIQATAGVGTDPRGRWERYQAFGDVSVQNTLIEHADGLLEEANSPASVWQIECEPEAYFSVGNYAVGEFVTIAQPRSTVYPIGIAVPTITAQVLARTLSQSADGEITVSIQAVEVP